MKNVRTVDFGLMGFAVTQNFYFLSWFQCACRNSPGDDGASENNLKSRPKLDTWVELKWATITLLFLKKKTLRGGNIWKPWHSSWHLIRCVFKLFKNAVHVLMVNGKVKYIDPYGGGRVGMFAITGVLTNKKEGKRYFFVCFFWFSFKNCGFYFWNLERHLSLMALSYTKEEEPLLNFLG